MFDDESFDTLAFSADAFDFGLEAPEAAPILLGRRPRVDTRRENDEALLIAMGLL